jgi:hypothetical protein
LPIRFLEHLHISIQIKSQYGKRIHIDGIMDFLEYCPGEVIDIFNGIILVSTIEGSLLIL